MPEYLFTNKEYPKTIADYVYLAREIEDSDELILANKEMLVDLVRALKRKELEYYVKFWALLNHLGEIDEKLVYLEDISHGNEGKIITELRKKIQDIKK